VDDLIDRTRRALEARGLDLCELFVLGCGEIEAPAPGRQFAQFAKNLADGDPRGGFPLVEYEAAFRRLLARGLLVEISAADLALNDVWPAGRINYHVGDVVLSEAGYALHTEIILELFDGRIPPKNFTGVPRRP
jgi:hypothetical protein